MKLFTVGYEGLDIEDFCKDLKKSRITLVADVRKNPVSRKRGFSKNRLKESLAAYKISYLHLPSLGVPTQWRKNAKAGLISRKRMFENYKNQILPLAKEALQILRDKMPSEKLALLCYEADALDCHRKHVVQKLQRLEKNNIQVKNLKFQQRRIL